MPQVIIVNDQCIVTPIRLTVSSRMTLGEEEDQNLPNSLPAGRPSSPRSEPLDCRHVSNFQILNSNNIPIHLSPSTHRDSRLQSMIVIPKPINQPSYKSALSNSIAANVVPVPLPPTPIQPPHLLPQPNTDATVAPSSCPLYVNPNLDIPFIHTIPNRVFPLPTQPSRTHSPSTNPVFNHGDIPDDNIHQDTGDELVSDSGDESSHCPENLDEREPIVQSEEVSSFISKKLAEIKEILNGTETISKTREPLVSKKERKIGKRSQRRKKRAVLLLQAEEKN